MSDLILHHFDISPFAEKIRLVFGLKGLAWHSVQIPVILPKPDLTALTGGYRKTPVLQIGADIYCDTQCIARELERRYPEPTLFPQGSRGFGWALSRWSDQAFFEPGAGLSMGENRAIPEAVLSDRKAFFEFMDFDVLDRELPHLYVQLRAHLHLVDEQLADGDDFLTGAKPGYADVLAYFPLWMVRANVPGTAGLVTPLTRLTAWERRMQGIGHGRREEMEAAQSHAIARAAGPAPGKGIAPGEPLPFAVGQSVSVTPTDYGRDPVRGQLVTLDVHEVAVRRSDPRCGEVVVHFPRIGYRID